MPLADWVHNLPQLLPAQSHPDGESISGPVIFPLDGIFQTDESMEELEDEDEGQGVTSIDILYLKPNTTQKRIEAKLLCSLGPRRKLMARLERQQNQRVSEIFGSQPLDLPQIFTPTNRKRKRSCECRHGSENKTTII